VWASSCTTRCHGVILMKDTSRLPEKDSPLRLSTKVRVISPISDFGKEGIVVEVLDPLGDMNYRYSVRFGDGTVAKFFRFELELVT